MTHFSDVCEPKFEIKQNSCFNSVINDIYCTHLLAV